MSQKGKILSVSVDSERQEQEAFRILDGDDQSIARVMVQHPDGSRAEVKLVRSLPFYNRICLLDSRLRESAQAATKS
jgi:hypothetical protein